MAVRVAPGAEDLACDLAGRFLLQVAAPSDAAAATRALQLARGDLLALAPDLEDDGVLVSNAVLGPHGPLLRVAGLDVGERLLATVPQRVLARLAEERVSDAVVEVLEPGGPLDALDDTRHAVVLRVFPTPAGEAGEIPPAWIDVASEWVLGDLRGQDQVPVRLLGAAYTVTAADAPAVLHQAALAHGWCDIVQGSLRDRIRTASLTFGSTPHLALAAGGPGCDIAALLARFDLLRELARELHDGVAYACLDIEATFEGVGLGLAPSGWRSQGGASANLVAGLLADVCVPDAYPFQVLGPEHIERFTRPGDRKSLGTRLPDGRTALQLGEAIDWHPLYDSREEQLELGWKTLGPLLVTDAEAATLIATRSPHRRATDTTRGAASGPDLTSITLDALPHPRRGLRLTFLELASWLAHEPHSDAPRSVSPVVAAYARWLASSLDDDRRQQLVSRAGPAIRTRSRSLGVDTWRLLPAEDEARAWTAIDWLLRTQVPAWLTAAGRVAAASKIGAIKPTRGRGHLTRTLKLVAAALDGLAAAEADDDVDELAWEVWEHASEASGWVAASEAALQGVPSRVVEAVELHVLERSRGGPLAPRTKRGSAIDTARSAALEAVGLAAWDAGWAAAEAAIDETALVPYGTAYDRSRLAAGPRLDLDRDAVDTELDIAIAAGRDALVAAVLDHDIGATAWRSALTSAGRSTAGETWLLVEELTCGVVGDEPWSAGMTAAETAVGRVVHAAPELIERGVAASIAREAASAAARVASAAGTAAVQSVVDQLGDAAIRLLDDLIAVRK